MKTSFGIRLCAGLVVFLALSCVLAPADVLPVLHTKTDSYQNVTLVSRTDTHVFVQHSRGVASVKITELDAAAQRGLGLTSGGVVPVAGAAADGSTEPETLEGEQAQGAGLSPNNAARELRQSMAPLIAIIAGVWLIALAACLLFYIFYIILVRLICQKAGCPAGWWVWVPFPVLQRYALLKAAGMSWWWIGATVALNIAAGFESVRSSPAVALGVVVAWVALFIAEHVIWSVKISKARGKGIGMTICLIFPLTLPFAFIYLAFSGGSAAESDEVPPVKSMQTEPLPA
jgi:hypothetical protein